MYTAVKDSYVGSKSVWYPQMELSSALSRYADDTKPEGDPKPENDSEASPSP